MILKEISKRIYYLPNDEKGDRPTLGYVKGDDYSVMIDAGNSPKHLNLFNEGLKERGLPLPKYAIITHWHWDHTYGITSFDGQVVANNITNKQLEKMTLWQWTDEAMKDRVKSGEDIEFCDTHIRVEYANLSDIKVETADSTFEDELNLDLGSISCKVRLIGGPHSEDSTVIYVPEEKVLFVGDADCGDYYNGNGQCDTDKLKEYVEKLKGIDFETYIHGHCAPMSKEEAIDELEQELNNN